MSSDDPTQEESSDNALQVIEEAVALAPESVQQLETLVKNPTTVGILEFLTGVTATAVDKPSKFILSAGHLAQALASGKFLHQLYEEVQEYRKDGKISDEALNTDAGNTILVDLLRTVDSETLDKEKFEALKTIFFKTVWKDTDEHKQMVAYEYFQVCKKLNSLEILMLKTAYSMIKNSEKFERNLEDWENKMSERLGIAVDLIKHSRIRNAPVNQNPNSAVFQADYEGSRHGLTELGVAIGQLIDRDSLEG